MAERFIDQAFRAQVNSNPPEHPFPPHERVSIPPPTAHHPPATPVPYAHLPIPTSPPPHLQTRVRTHTLAQPS